MKSQIRYIGAASVALIAAFIANHALAEPADYVHTPSVTQGEREIDFKFGTQKKEQEDRASAASIGFGYGVTAYWSTELYVKYKREDGNGTGFAAYEWENKCHLPEPGQSPVDSGLLTEIERPQERGEGYEVRVGPLVQTEVGR